MLHADGVTSAKDADGNVYIQKSHSRILPDKDCSINRENPNRKLPNSKALVVGFDAKGNFQGVMPKGTTHGYWTLSKSFLTPDDGAGADGDYVARTLLEFDLNSAGITNGDYLESCQLSLYYYKSNTVPKTGNYIFDFYRFHPGTTANEVFTENATWWEYDYSGTATLGSTGEFAITEGGTHGSNLWDNQGLGTTGSTAEHNAVPTGTTAQWLDISGGVIGANNDSYTDNLYDFGLSATRRTVTAGQLVNFDITDAAKDAFANYNNKLRLMIRLRDDETYDNSDSIVFLSFYSTESEPSPLAASASSPPQYAPSISVTYWNHT